MPQFFPAAPLAAACLALAPGFAAAMPSARLVPVHHDLPHRSDGAQVVHKALTIGGAFARASARVGSATAAYMTVSIAAGEDRLVAAESPVAARVELHTHEVDAQGVARMREVAAIAVRVDEPAVLEPGGLHVMLMGLAAPLAEGDTVPLTLVFETAGPVTFEVPVRATPRGHGPAT